jgi:hypothetical protein
MFEVRQPKQKREIDENSHVMKLNERIQRTFCCP